MAAFACQLEAFSEEQRREHTDLARQLLGQVRTAEELSGGYALRFSPHEETARSLLTFVLLERRCCPFLSLSLEFAADGGPLSLILGGPEGVKPFLYEEFGLARLPLR